MVNVEADKVVLAMGMIPQVGLFQELRGKAPDVYLIGDSAEPRRVGEATREGYKVASTI